ncbi:helix-turn-helix domain-containing protein [Geodermatophilus sp. SYSU D00079]
MPYPPRPGLRPLPEFAGTARSGNAAAGDVQARLERFVIEQYAAGRSLREVAELVDRSQTAVRRVLDKHGVHRRQSGAAVAVVRAG